MPLAMPWIKKILVFCLCTGLPFVQLKAQEKISLQHAVELALDRNLTIKQAQFNEALATEDYKQAKNNLYPSLGVNSQGSYNFGRSPNLTTYSYTSQSCFFIN
jgi:outer membrane protein